MHLAGVGIYPMGALINHSCRPNAVQSFDGAAIRFVAVCDIAPGQVLLAFIFIVQFQKAVQCRK